MIFLMILLGFFIDIIIVIITILLIKTKYEYYTSLNATSNNMSLERAGQTSIKIRNQIISDTSRKLEEKQNNIKD